jgi:shikimate dehydrogenase
VTPVSANSRVLAIVGDPVRHSLSPAMHNAAIAALGLDAVYVAIHADPAAMPHVIRAFEAVGIAGNVTVPHKVTAAQLLIRLTPVAKELGAVNTFWSEAGRLVGDNTDVAGALDSLEQIGSPGPWAVAGTGGAARAIAAAARSRGVSLGVTSRDPARARDFVAWARDLQVDAFADDGRPVGTVINATPLGLKPEDALPFPRARIAGAAAALDLVYTPGETRWVHECRRVGLRAVDGRAMLVAQGAHAFERFFPGCAAPLEIMAAVVDRALRA